MNVFLTIANRVRLYHKRRQIKTIADFERQLEDQVISGTESLHYWRKKRFQLEAECGLLESPDDIARRAGVGA